MYMCPQVGSPACCDSVHFQMIQHVQQSTQMGYGVHFNALCRQMQFGECAQCHICRLPI